MLHRFSLSPPRFHATLIRHRVITSEHLKTCTLYPPTATPALLSTLKMFTVILTHIDFQIVLERPILANATYCPYRKTPAYSISPVDSRASDLRLPASAEWTKVWSVACSLWRKNWANQNLEQGTVQHWELELSQGGGGWAGWCQVRASRGQAERDREQEGMNSHVIWVLYVFPENVFF